MASNRRRLHRSCSASTSREAGCRTSDGGRLTTHVLDTAAGRPAAGLAISLFRIDGDSRNALKTAVDQCRRALRRAAAGRRQLCQPATTSWSSQAGDYFRGQGLKLPTPAFLDVVPIRFGLAEPVALSRAAADFAVRLFHLSGQLNHDRDAATQRDPLPAQWRGPGACRSRAGRDAARLPAAAPAAHRHQGGLRGRRLRRLHGAGRPPRRAASCATKASMPASASWVRSTAATS